MALAHHLKFQEVIAFQEEGAPLEGFLKYIQANPEKFRDEKELLEKVEQIIRARGWNSQYSRNLVVSETNRIGPLSYGDHTGSSFEWVWDIKVENRRLDIAAINTSCLLDYIIFPNGEKKDCPDRSWLKWGRQIGYQRTILPQDYGVVNIFAIHYNENGIYLHSAQDVVPRAPIVTKEGDYKFYYKIFAEHFPLLSFAIQVNYRYTGKKLLGKCRFYSISFSGRRLLIGQVFNDHFLLKVVYMFCMKKDSHYMLAGLKDTLLREY